MKIAFVGCGYVADFYARNLASHPDLTLVGAYDEDHARRDAWCRHFAAAPYGSLNDLVTDAGVEMVLNLTKPRSQFAVSAAAIRAGKHVYTEKPLG